MLYLIKLIVKYRLKMRTDVPNGIFPNRYFIAASTPSLRSNTLWNTSLQMDSERSPKA